MKEEISCGAIIINNNKVLLVEQQTNFIGFPKGHIEGNETYLETAIREVKEETNLDIKIDEKLKYELSYLIKNNTVNKKVILFLAHPINNINIQKQEEEIKNILWVDIAKVRDTLTFDNLKEVWDKVLIDYKKISSKSN